LEQVGVKKPPGENWNFPVCQCDFAEIFGACVFYSGVKKLHTFGTGLLYVGTVLLEPAPLPSLEDVLQEEETREEA